METSDLANDTLFGASKQVVPKNRWHLNRMRRIECYRITGLRWLKIPSAPTWWLATFYMNQSWSVIISQACSSFPLCICFFESFFCLFGAFMCVSNAFFYKGCMSLISGQRTGPSTGDNVFSGSATSRDTADLDAEWGGITHHHPTPTGQWQETYGKYGKISWQFLLGVVFFRCFFPEFHSANG